MPLWACGGGHPFLLPPPPSHWRPELQIHTEVRMVANDFSGPGLEEVRRRVLAVGCRVEGPPPCVPVCSPTHAEASLLQPNRRTLMQIRS